MYSFTNLKSEIKVLIGRFDDISHFTEEVFQKTVVVAQSIIIQMKDANQIGDHIAPLFGKLITRCVL